MSAIPTYASTRSQLPDTAFSVSAIAGTTTAAVAGNYNIYLSAENRAGLNKPSNPKPLTIASGDGVTVTINSDAIATGEDPFFLVISIEKTGNPQNAVRVAAFKVKENNQVTQRSLPVTINLTTDEHFNTNRSYALFEDLPSAGILDGAIAFISGNGNYYRYDSEALTANDRLLSYGAVSEGAGNWVRYFGTFNTFTEDPTVTSNNVRGSDRPLNTISNAIITPTKELIDIDSTPIIYWLNNDFAADGGSPIVNGTYQLQVFINSLDYTGVFNNKIKYRFLGYCDRATGILDSIDTAGQTKIWNQANPIKLPQDLPRNHAAVYEIWFSYQASELYGVLPDTIGSVGFNIVAFGNNTGQLDAAANSLGDLVYSDRDRLLIVPGEFRLKGMATIKMPDAIGYRIDTTTEDPIPGLLPDTPNQIAAMSGSTNGLITIRQQGDSLEFSEVVRAYISTESGIGNAIASTQVTLSNQRLEITVAHSVEPTGQGKVRDSYPDPYLAGNIKGNFTATNGRAYANINGVFYQSALIPVVATGGQPEQIITLDLRDLTAIALLPVQSDPAFGLFAAEFVAIAGSGSGSISGDVTAYWAYEYPSPNNKATKIQHDLTGTIPTLTGEIGSILSQLSQLVDHLINTNNPHQVTTSQIGAANQTDLDETDSNVADNSSAIATLQTTVNSLGQTAIAVSNLEKKICFTAESIGSLPRSLVAGDEGKELIVINESGQLTIPDDVTNFPEDYTVQVCLEGSGSVLFEREDGNQTDLIFSNNNQNLRSTGIVIISRRGNTNVFKVIGNLES